MRTFALGMVAGLLLVPLAAYVSGGQNFDRDRAGRLRGAEGSRFESQRAQSGPDQKKTEVFRDDFRRGRKKAQTGNQNRLGLQWLKP